MTAAVEHRSLLLSGDLNFDERREFMVATQSASSPVTRRCE